MFDLGRNTTTLSKFIGCIDLTDVHQISPNHPRNNDKGKCVRKFGYGTRFQLSGDINNPAFCLDL